ncbi:hypothetical protein P7C73_g3002, partial [Tremellales sp. Uapishka_1]
MLPTTMQGVVLKAPFKVAVEEVPYPSIRDTGDVVIKVLYSGLCGSDLHCYRGHEGQVTGYVLGHEAVGRIVEKGSGVEGFSIGELVLSPFSVSCGTCYYCQNSYTSRCESGVLLGTPDNPGAQAEYLRVPLASSSLVHLDPDLPPQLALLLCDILPTGVSVATNAKRLLDEERDVHTAEGKKGVCLVIGCGPVGLCAISAATLLFDRVFATDLTPSRLVSAERHGATALPLDKLLPAIHQATHGRGADAVLEVVGNPKALDMAIQCVRPYGAISSCGVHNQSINLLGPVLYGKNLRFQFGRCSVKTFYPLSLEILKANLDLFSNFVEQSAPLEEAPIWYERFEKGEIGKTVFVMEEKIR